MERDKRLLIFSTIVKCIRPTELFEAVNTRKYIQYKHEQTQIHMASMYMSIYGCIVVGNKHIVYCYLTAWLISTYILYTHKLDLCFDANRADDMKTHIQRENPTCLTFCTQEYIASFPSISKWDIQLLNGCLICV